MRTYFEAAYRLILSEEGGYTKDPRDPGNWTGGKCGKGILKGTKYGISAASYPTLDIENLTLADAHHIYKVNYWDKMQGDLLPWALALPLFDAAINEGVSRAVMQLQEALGFQGKQIDGKLGQSTLTRALCADPVNTMIKFMAAQLAFKKRLRIWFTYGKGWSNRIVRITALASKEPT